MTAHRVPFDWRQVQARQENGEWKLAAGGLVLAHFGNNDREARLALAAIRHYRFTEQWRIGGEEPVFTYYTASGQAPLGVMLGITAQPFQPSQLSIQQVAGRYALCEGTKVVVRLGERPEEAKQLLETIQRNKYDRLCQVGKAEGKEGVTFLVRSR